MGDNPWSGHRKHARKNKKALQAAYEREFMQEEWQEDNRGKENKRKSR